MKHDKHFGQSNKHHYLWMICILIVIGAVNTFASLTPGAIALTAFNMDNPDELSFMVLEDLDAGEEIHFTDNGWLPDDSFRTGEGIMTYTVPAGGLSAGTVITQAVSSMLLSASGDQILVYQGEISDPHFIYALNAEDAEWQTNAATANESALPRGLTNGYTAVAIAEMDNAYFDFTVMQSGSKSEWLTAISTPSNWIGHNSERVSIVAGSYPIEDAEDPNQPPQLCFIPDTNVLSATAGTPMSFDVTAIQPEGDQSDETTLAAIVLPEGASFPPQNATGSLTGTFTWTPTIEQTGTFTAVFTAGDKDGTVTNTMAVTVHRQRTVEFTANRIITEETETSQTIIITLNGAESSVANIAQSGTATMLTDYQLSTNQVQFIGTETAQITLTVLPDSLSEGPETITLSITNAIGSSIGTQHVLRIVIRDNDSFSIASANLGAQLAPVDTCYEEYSGRILEGILPDITAVQEFNVTNRGVYADYRDFVDRHFGTGFSYHVENEEIYGKMPNGIISRWPIIDSGEWADDDLFNRDFAWATVQLPCDRLLHVISVHLKAGEAVSDIDRRVIEAQLLTNHIIASFSPTNFIALCGDFNLTGRDEATLLVLTNLFPYTQTPKDQYGYKNTNKTREYPFDWVMPNLLLDQQTVTTYIHGTPFPEGAVFDSRFWETPPYPVQTNDSVAEGLQHMVVLRQFAFTAAIPLAENETIAHYSFDTETEGTNTAAHTDSHVTASAFTSSDNSITYLQGSPSSGYAVRDTGWDTFEHYFSFTLTIAEGYQAFLDTLSFDGLRGSTGPANWSIFSSADNYTDSLADGSYPMEDAWATAVVALGLDFVTGDITFRLYGSGAETSTGNWRIDNVILSGTVIEIDPDDQDADGLPDQWENECFAALDIADSTTDTDGDGALDRDEYIAGTIPTDALSTLCVGSTVSTENQITLTWPSASNRLYTVYTSENLTEGFRVYTADIIATPPYNSQNITITNDVSVYYKIKVRMQ